MPGIGQCAICFSTLLSSDMYAVIKCGPIFHRNCILQWIHTGKNCPSCRVSASERHVIKLFIQETSLDDSFTTQNKLEAKVKRRENKILELKEKLELISIEKEGAESLNGLLNLKIRKLESDVACIPALRSRIQQMHSYVTEVINHAAFRRELTEAKNKLNASELLLAKEKESCKQRLAEANATIKTLEKELNYAVNDKRVKRRIVVEEYDENYAEYRPSTSKTKPPPDWQPSSSPTISANSIPSPVARFTRNCSLANNLGQSKNFGTTINDKRPLVTRPSMPTMNVETRPKWDDFWYFI
jgi:hypothetical protein